MNRARNFRACSLALFSFTSASAVALAQDPIDVHPPATFTAEDFFVPLSTIDTESAGQLWAGGSNWKARFEHRAFTFFPWLGADAPRHLPWTWTTARVLADGRPLQTDAAAALTRLSPGIAELDHGPVLERYEVRPEGIEQTFVLRAPLPASEDLVVEGRIDTELHAAVVADQHGALMFHDDDGRAVVSYGAATVLDAGGRRLAIPSGFDGESISLRVPADWLARASYPVTIDPLTSPVLVYTWASGDGVIGISIGRNDEHDELMVGFTRQFVVGDRDLYVRVANDSFGNRQTIHTNLANNHDTIQVSLDYVRGAHRWVVAYDDDYSNQSRMQLYFHDGGVGAAIPGILRTTASSSSYDRWAPSFGGSTGSEPYGYVVYRRDHVSAGGNSSTSRVYGSRINASTRTVEAASLFRASAHANPDAERPSVSRRSQSNSGWLVVWNEYDPANSTEDWDVLAQRVTQDGNLRNWHVCGDGGNVNLHKISPVVAGSITDFRVAFLLRDGTGDKPTGDWGNEIHTERMFWPQNSASPTRYPATQLVTRTSNDLQLHGADSMAYDSDLDSHCALIWRDLQDGLYITNIGWEGRSVETAQLLPQSPAVQFLRGSVTFDADGLRFPLLASAWGSQNPISGRHLERRPASVIEYGSSCGGRLRSYNSGSTSNPYAGSGGFAIYLVAGRPDTSTWLFASTGSANLPLPAAASGSCALLLDAASSLIAVASGQSDSRGGEFFFLPLPSHVQANVYWQAVQISGASAWSTTALRTNIR